MLREMKPVPSVCLLTNFEQLLIAAPKGMLFGTQKVIFWLGQSNTMKESAEGFCRWVVFRITEFVNPTD
jgi:hypothetical protein